MLVKECGNLLEKLEEQKNTAQKKLGDEEQIYAIMIGEYQRELLRLEEAFKIQDSRKYLEIRRARYAVEKGMEKTIPADVLYAWMVQNLCDLEDVE